MVLNPFPRDFNEEQLESWKRSVVADCVRIINYVLSLPKHPDEVSLIFKLEKFDHSTEFSYETEYEAGKWSIFSPDYHEGETYIVEIGQTNLKKGA